MAKEITPISADLGRLDAGLAFRDVTGWIRMAAGSLAVALSLFHVYTAGFGVLIEMKHRSTHLTFVLALVFLLFPARRVSRKARGPGWELFMDLVGALLTGWIAMALPGDLFQVEGFTRWAFFAAGLYASLYWRRRESWKGVWGRLADLVIGGGGLILWVQGVAAARPGWSEWPVSLRIWGTCAALGTAACLGKVLWESLRPLSRTRAVPTADLLLAVLSAAGAFYVTADFHGIVSRAGLPIERDLLWGALTLLLVLEATRRSTGPDLALLGVAALAFSYAGPVLEGLPILGFFAHRGYRVDRIVEHMILGTEGVFGIPLGVVATYVFHFVLFGILVNRTGLGQLFMDTALVLAGRTRGGPAKVAVLASGFFGSISGSSIANTVTTGTFTIPLMRRLGYSGRYAAAVEATASTGGQITPPIMGAAAFIMAEFLNIPYLTIATSAIVPAALYYLGVGTMVHLEAVKRDIKGLEPGQLPDLKESFRRNGWMLLPMAAIVALLIQGMSPFLSAFWGILLSASLSQGRLSRRPLLLPSLMSIPLLLWPEAFSAPRPEWLLAGVAAWFLLKSDRKWTRWAAAAIAAAEAAMVVFLGAFLAAVWGNLLVVFLSWAADALETGESARGSNRLRFPDAIVALEQGARNALSIGTACACVGLVIGAASLTGLGLKFAQATTHLAALAAENLLLWLPFGELVSIQVFLTLVFTMVACSLLGSGLPTTATYIILITFAAPAFRDLGIPLLAAHMFILYYGVLSDVIPPVALSAYAGAALAREDPFRTGFTAVRLAAGGILVPFIFVYNPSLLLLPWLGLAEAESTYPLAAAIIASVLAVTSLGAGLTGHFLKPNRWYEGAGLLAGGVLLAWRGWEQALAGALLVATVGLLQRLRG
ncbi:MAG: TRAP transporter permease [Nitrospinota bacterium]